MLLLYSTARKEGSAMTSKYTIMDDVECIETIDMKV
jgi:hypothetical protein